MKYYLLLPFIGLAFLSGVQAQTAIWTGATSNSWSDAGNWSGTGGAPDTSTEYAQFDSVSTNDAPNLAAATTIGKLSFLSGAGTYTISGSALTIQAAGATTFLLNSSGTTQTINTDLVYYFNSGTSAITSVASGSTLTMNGKLTLTNGSNLNASFSGGGTVNFNGSFAAVNQFSVSDVTMNLNPTSWSGLNSVWSTSNAGRVNLLKGMDSSRQINIASSSGTAGRVYLTAAGITNASVVNFNGTNSANLTFGADISGGGTATQSGGVKISNTGAGRTGATYRLYAAADNTLIVTGVVSDANAAGSGTKVEISGGGVVRYAGTGANTSITPISVVGARLELSKTAGVNAIGGGSVSIGTDGEVRLLAANQIADGTALTLSGGTFNSNGLSESLGALTVDVSNGTIDLGSGASQLTFSSLAGLTGTLTITGWSGSLTGGGTDQILFTDISGWTEDTLSRVVFVGYGTGATLVGNELVAIPEPETWALLLAGVAWLVRARRREA